MTNYENDIATPDIPVPQVSKRCRRRQERHTAHLAIERDIVELTDLDEPVLVFEPVDDEVLTWLAVAAHPNYELNA